MRSLLKALSEGHCQVSESRSIAAFAIWASDKVSLISAAIVDFPTPQLPVSSNVGTDMARVCQALSKTRAPAMCTRAIR